MLSLFLRSQMNEIYEPKGIQNAMKELARGTILTVKCINNDGYPCSLTIGKLYKARIGQLGSLGVWDNDNDGCYSFDKKMFEIVKEGWDGDKKLNLP